MGRLGRMFQFSLGGAQPREYEDPDDATGHCVIETLGEAEGRLRTADRRAKRRMNASDGHRTAVLSLAEKPDHASRRSFSSACEHEKPPATRRQMPVAPLLEP